MKFQKYFLLLSFIFAVGCQSEKIVESKHDSNTSLIQNVTDTEKSKTVSRVAEEWLKCPPPNPRRPDLCKSACCGDGSNWYVSCITFVGEISKEANGYVDQDLLTGYSIHPGKTYGNPMKAWQSLKKSGRAQTDLSKIEPGSAVFYKIPTFPRGHVAIYTGEKDNSGEPLVITSGGYRQKNIRKEKISEEVRAVNAEILGWAKIK